MSALATAGDVVVLPKAIEPPKPKVGSIPPRLTDGTFMAHKDAPWINIPSEGDNSPSSAATAVQTDLASLREQVPKSSRQHSRASSVASARSQRSIPEHAEVQHELSPAIPSKQNPERFDMALSDAVHSCEDLVDDSLVEDMLVEQAASADGTPRSFGGLSTFSEQLSKSLLEHAHEELDYQRIVDDKLIDKLAESFPKPPESSNIVYDATLLKSAEDEDMSLEVKLQNLQQTIIFFLTGIVANDHRRKRAE